MRHRPTLTALLLALAVFATACTTGGGGEDEPAVEESPTAAAEEPAADPEEPAEDAPAEQTPEDDETEPAAEAPEEPATDDEPEPAPEPTPIVLTASFRGVTEDTIRIGVGFWDVSLFGFGFFGDPEPVWDALTGAVNAEGNRHIRIRRMGQLTSRSADVTVAADQH